MIEFVKFYFWCKNIPTRDWLKNWLENHPLIVSAEKVNDDMDKEYYPSLLITANAEIMSGRIAMDLFNEANSIYKESLIKQEHNFI